MNEKGDIISKEELGKLSASEQKKFIEVPEEQLEKVLKMNRAARRAFYKSQRPARKAAAKAAQQQRILEKKEVK